MQTGSAPAFLASGLLPPCPHHPRASAGQPECHVIVCPRATTWPCASLAPVLTRVSLGGIPSWTMSRCWDPSTRRTKWPVSLGSGGSSSHVRPSFPDANFLGLVSSASAW